tara:strand:- start:5448 stop:6260 length:813 start_codon:yes stop_codon:yes gene_type:complete
MITTEQYDENGYYLAKGALNNDWVSRAKESLKKIEPKVYLPFSDIPWGYGQLFDVSPFDEITSNSVFVDFHTNVLNINTYNINHLLVSNKSAFIGPEEMWHQEWPNINTFSPGCSPEKDWKKFTQVFIAVDEMTIHNGCLRIVPKSHTLGMVEHEDIVWNNMAHKKRAKHSEMKKAVDKLGILEVPMKPGDILFFNHRILHASSSNISENDRKAIVMQLQFHGIEKDLRIFDKYNNHRTKFLVETYKNKINSELKNNKYKDFNNDKKGSY